MPYVETWFDAIDYIDEITTEQLEKELKRRGHDIGAKTIDIIKTDLDEAWVTGDEVLFNRAIRMIENPENEQRRIDEIAKQYKEFMERKQATHYPPPQLSCKFTSN